MPNRGKFVVVSIFTVAIGLAVFAWWYRWQQGRQAAEFWGNEASTLIVAAPKVELLRLKKAASDEPTPAVEKLTIAGESFTIVDCRYVQNSPGLIHARHSLVEDASYEWHRRPTDCESEWSLAVRFEDETTATTVVFDFHCNQVKLLKSDKQETLVPRIADGWKRVLERAATIATSEAGATPPAVKQ